MVKGSGLRAIGGSWFKVKGEWLLLPLNFLYDFFSFGMIYGEERILVKSHLGFSVND